MSVSDQEGSPLFLRSIGMSFRDDYLQGKIAFDEIYTLTDEWSFSDELCTLREYLGLTAQEEDIWISESDEALEEFLNAERNRKVLFADLDGTLLDDEKRISDKNRRMIKEALKEGHVICVSTGRAYPSALRQARRLALDQPDCYLSCYNGGQIYSLADGKLLYSTGIPFETVRACYDEAAAMDVFLQTYNETDVLAAYDSPLLREYCRIQALPYSVTDDVVSLMTVQPPKLLALGDDHEKLERFRRRLAEVVGEKITMFFSNPYYLEIMPTGINKGSAIRFLCSYLGIPVANSVAAGDAENDMAMIEAAGIGAVMCNGEEALKQKADYVTTLDNNHDGAAEIIERYILNRRS